MTMKFSDIDRNLQGGEEVEVVRLRGLLTEIKQKCYLFDSEDVNLNSQLDRPETLNIGLSIPVRDSLMFEFIFNYLGMRVGCRGIAIRYVGEFSGVLAVCTDSENSQQGLEFTVIKEARIIDGQYCSIFRKNEQGEYFVEAE